MWRRSKDQKKPVTPQIAIQLYSLRTLTGKDALGTLSKLSDLGYRNVELAGTYGIADAEFALEMRSRNLNVCSAHISWGQVNNNFDAIRAQAEAIGFEYVVVPSMPIPKTKAAWVERAGEFNKLGEKFSGAGLKLGFHNHAGELVKVEGEHGLNIFFDHTEPELVVAEPDLAWILAGGADPVAWLKRYKGRTPVSHYKDLKDSKVHASYGPGQGVIDWDGVIDASVEGGMKYAIVEFEKHDMPPLEEADLSRKFLVEKGLRG